MSNVIIVDRLSKDFREGFLARRKTAVDAVSFSVEEGALYGFIGPNGAGKSTTLHLLMGFLHPSRGQAIVCGHSSSDPQARASVGFLPEVFAFDRFSTGVSLLRRFDALSRRLPHAREQRVRDALEQVDLLLAAQRRIGTYSKGMLQRIGLAQALLGDPRLLILDEPMSGMDPATRLSVRELFRNRRERGRTTVFSSHILSDVEELADRVLILNRGRTVFEGALTEIHGQYDGTTILFRDQKPDRFDTFLAERHLIRNIVADEPGLARIEVPDVSTKSDVVARLAAEGAEIVSVIPRHTNLEDIFLQLTAGSPLSRFHVDRHGWTQK